MLKRLAHGVCTGVLATGCRRSTLLWLLAYSIDDREAVAHSSIWDVRSTSMSRHRQLDRLCPKSANRRLTQRSNYQLFARVRSVVNAQKESESLSIRRETGSGKTRDWKSIQEKPVEDTAARPSF
jgi:hypothetical protein